MMNAPVSFRPGDLVKVRGREWVILPEQREDVLSLRPLGGAEEDATHIYLPLEPEPPVAATFELPDPEHPGSQQAALLLRDALRLKLRAGAGPFRSFGNINVEPRAYQLVPLLMALKLDPVRLLIADDVGIGKTIEAGLIARELLDRGEVKRLTVICPPHLCEQWQRELDQKFLIEAKVVRPSTATRLERGLRPDESVFEVYPYTIVSLDYIKSDRRRDDFLRTCSEFVIVDEAHSCVRSDPGSRHQRYQLLAGLASREPLRNLVLLTATPHSGDDTAFHNLLGLLQPRFAELAEMPEGEGRRALRKDLSLHFVQRRRGDIAEWKDTAGFPVRERRDATYRLTGDWGRLFDEVFSYARAMVERAEGGTNLQQRMSWWAALALLRCISSSPAAAFVALRTRLRAAEGATEYERVTDLDRIGAETVLDASDNDLLSNNETVPAGTVDSTEDVETLGRLIKQANDLRGPRRDPKLKVVVNEVQDLIAEGYRPVVFCRFIATADYVGKELKAALPKHSTCVDVVTGGFTSDERERRVEELGELEDHIVPVLVATDCLSEGINLQCTFNAVVHYDLTWNPTRHEQREGRVDRFGQASRTVRALMLYGEDNSIDLAVLRVILDKAEKIRKELGVAVPLPTDNNRVVEAIMKAVLLGSGPQRTLDFGETEVAVDTAWKGARDKVTRTVFAQHRLQPDQVLPEWKKSISVLGGRDDVARFVRLAAERLGAPLDDSNGSCRLPVPHLPSTLRDRLAIIGLNEAKKIAFDRPVPEGADYIFRAHPLVKTLADYVTEQALDNGASEIGARTSAIFTNGVEARTVLFLLRVRCQIQIERLGADGRDVQFRSLLAEECLGVAVQGGPTPEVLTDDEALELLSLEPRANMADGQKTHLIRSALESIGEWENEFERIARDRARQLLEDHRRIRQASDASGLRFNVLPALPVDKIGIYVLMPFRSL